jgi:flavin-dependent dehydrogenase
LPGNLDGCSWRGTAALTRRPQRTHDERLLLIGDAAGYVEPFTGEGIAWALWSAVAVTPLVVRGVQDWTPAIGEQWSSLHRRVIARRQVICRAVSRLLRSPMAMDVTRFVLTRAPWLAHPVIRALNAPPRRWK